MSRAATASTPAPHLVKFFMDESIQRTIAYPMKYGLRKTVIRCYYRHLKGLLAPGALLTNKKTKLKVNKCQCPIPSMILSSVLLELPCPHMIQKKLEYVSDTA